jgi:hypothetical protein
MCAQVRQSRGSGKKSRFLTIRLEQDLADELARVARKNERTLAGEIRLAARRHLDAIAKDAA